MPRGGSGTCTLAEAAFVANTAIKSAVMNSDLSDIADMLTDSLSRSGSGGMTAQLALDNTGFSYSTDPNTGMSRSAADAQVITCGGTDVVTVTETGASVAGTLDVSGALTVGGSALLLIGEVKMWTGLTAPSKWKLLQGDTLLRASFPDLWTFAAAQIALGSLLFTNGNGTTTFTIPDMRGRAPAGVDPTGSRLTGATMTPNGNTMGAVGGLETETLTLAQTPTGITSANAAQAISVTTQNGGIPDTLTATSRPTAGGATSTLDNNGNLRVQTSTGNNSISVTSNNTGGAAHPNVQPTIQLQFIIYAGA